MNFSAQKCSFTEAMSFIAKGSFQHCNNHMKGYLHLLKYVQKKRVFMALLSTNFFRLRHVQAGNIGF